MVNETMALHRWQEQKCNEFFYLRLAKKSYVCMNGHDLIRCVYMNVVDTSLFVIMMIQCDVFYSKLDGILYYYIKS